MSTARYTKIDGSSPDSEHETRRAAPPANSIQKNAYVPLSNPKGKITARSFARADRRPSVLPIHGAPTIEPAAGIPFKSTQLERVKDASETGNPFQALNVHSTSEAIRTHRAPNLHNPSPSPNTEFFSPTNGAVSLGNVIIDTDNTDTREPVTRLIPRRSDAARLASIERIVGTREDSTVLPNKHMLTNTDSADARHDALTDMIARRMGAAAGSSLQSEDSTDMPSRENNGLELALLRHTEPNFQQHYGTTQSIPEENPHGKAASSFWKKHFIIDSRIAWYLLAFSGLMLIIGVITRAIGSHYMDIGAIDCTTNPNDPSCNNIPSPLPPSPSYLPPSPSNGSSPLPSPSNIPSASPTPLPFAKVKIPSSQTMHIMQQTPFISNVEIDIKTLGHLFDTSRNPYVYLEGKLSNVCLNNIKGSGITLIDSTTLRSISVPYSESATALPNLWTNATAINSGKACTFNLLMWCLNCVANSSTLLTQSNMMDIIGTSLFASPQPKTLRQLEGDIITQNNDYKNDGQLCVNIGNTFIAFGAITFALSAILLGLHYYHKQIQSSNFSQTNKTNKPIRGTIQSHAQYKLALTQKPLTSNDHTTTLEL